MSMAGVAGLANSTALPLAPRPFLLHNPLSSLRPCFQFEFVSGRQPDHPRDRIPLCWVKLRIGRFPKCCPALTVIFPARIKVRRAGVFGSPNVSRTASTMNLMPLVVSTSTRCEIVASSNRRFGKSESYVSGRCDLAEGLLSPDWLSLHDWRIREDPNAHSEATILKSEGPPLKGQPIVCFARSAC